MQDEADYVSVAECAQRMGITTDQVMDLVERHALKAYRWAGWGDLLVQPAITNVTPKAERVARGRVVAGNQRTGSTKVTASPARRPTVGGPRRQRG